MMQKKSMDNESVKLAVEAVRNGGKGTGAARSGPPAVLTTASIALEDPLLRYHQAVAAGGRSKSVE